MISTRSQNRGAGGNERTASFAEPSTSPRGRRFRPEETSARCMGLSGMSDDRPLTLTEQEEAVADALSGGR